MVAPAFASVPRVLNFTAGSDPHVEQIFLGRCYDMVNRNLVPDIKTSCEDLWTLFSSGFLYKNDADVTPEDYAPFFANSDVVRSLRKQCSRQRSLFWSGISGVVEELQDDRHLFVMETSPIVDCLHDLVWCGSADDASGFNYTRCVYGDVSPVDNKWHGSWVSFWAAASYAYAPMVNGNVTMIFSGYAGHPAYRRTSFFGSVEMPNLDPKKITGVNVYVIPLAADEPLYERCDQKSLQLLRHDLIARGFDPATLTCTDDPQWAMHVLCARLPSYAGCQLPPTPPKTLPLNGWDRSRN